MPAIHFYSVADEYGEFSNFARYPIALKRKVWPTTEHYFQAQKFAGTAHEAGVRKAKTPGIAARMGRDRGRPLRRNWESVKLNVMRDALWAKFTQHPELALLLEQTGNRQIVEHTANDAFWGDGGNGSGLNWLGRMLVETRERLRRERGEQGAH